MATPVVKHKGLVKLTSDACAICPTHLMSDHVKEKAEQCSKCSCVAQDTSS